MPGQPVKIGPFTGGLNNVSLSGEAKDTEVVELVNFELALDTSLVSRPPLEVVNGTSSNLANQWDVLGIYRITNVNWYVVVNAPTGATTYEVRAYSNGDFTSAPTVIKTTTGLNNKIVSFVQYNDWVYFNVNTGASDTGFRWKVGTLTAIATMPRGNVMISWEDRIWITADGTGATGNYVWFSTVDSTGPKPDTWNTAVDFFNADPGSGGLNTAMLPLTNALLIFKEDATYRFSFPTAPKNGDLSNVSRAIGAASKNCVIAFESYAYVYDQGKIYELINNKFTQINMNVDFKNSATGTVDSLATDVDLSLINRRLMVRYFNTLFVYAVDTRTWSQWQSINGTPGKFIEQPGDSTSAASSKYVAASRGVMQNVGVNRIKDPQFLDSGINNKRLAVPGSIGGATIANSVATITKTGAGFPEFALSEDGTVGNYTVPVAPFQRWTITATTSTSVTATNKFILNFNFKYRDGTTSVTAVNILAADVPSLSEEILIPANAVLMSVSFATSATATVGQAFTISSPLLVRSNVAAPVALLRMADEYANSTAIELIECSVRTKSYDYQANSVFKRLFLWGLDVKTPRPISMSAMPLGKKRSVTWDDLESYTWDQLEAGTWDNPLSYLNVSNTIVDMASDLADVSENGRFFVKAGKSIKFRQIQYAVAMTTLGNADTGPAKLFSLTTYTKASELVVAKAT